MFIGEGPIRLRLMVEDMPDSHGISISKRLPANLTNVRVLTLVTFMNVRGEGLCLDVKKGSSGSSYVGVSHVSVDYANYFYRSPKEVGQF